MTPEVPVLPSPPDLSVPPVSPDLSVARSAHVRPDAGPCASVSPDLTVPEARRTVGWAFAFFAMLGGRVAGLALLPLLLVHAPVALLVLSPFVSHLVLLGGLLPGSVYYPVGVAVSGLQCLIGQQFGRNARPRALAWLESRRRESRLTLGIEWLSAGLRRTAPWVLILVPGPLTSALAGVLGVTGARFHVPMWCAQVLWVVACGLLGTRFAPALESLRAEIGAWIWPLTAGSIALVIGRQWRRASVIKPSRN